MPSQRNSSITGKSMRILRISAYVLLIALFIGAGQNTIHVNFSADHSRNTTIGAFEKNGTIYASLTDLLEVFRIHSTLDAKYKKLTFEGKKLTLQVSANNPFIVLVDADSATHIIQMPVPVLFAAKSFFVPVESFIPLFNNLVSDEIKFEPGKWQITIEGHDKHSPFDITGMNIEEKENGTVVRFISEKPLRNSESFSKESGEDTWLYVTVEDARVDKDAISKVKPSGAIREILLFPSPASTQFTFKIHGKISSAELVPVDGSNDLLLAIHPAPPEPSKPEKKGNLTETLDRERSRWKLDCIVIDAGHGGDDPGAIGVTRVREKDVTLPIALKLGRLIEKNLSDVKVVYTRKNDEFIELYKRGQIANAAGGKLFISIHCNSMPHKPNPAHGFEIYLLRPGKTENALRIAERENAVVKLEKDYEKRYQELTEEHFILLTMAQSAYVKYSEKFADICQKEMSKRLDLQNNGVKQAGFYVLVGASMPNVLVETAYLSNRHDEKMLKSGKGQDKIAEAIFSGIKRYKQEYEKSLSEGKEMDSSN
ncbi:MAG: N-acetylmuramoyl-L-alanine amidase [Bacteroidota bacterium]